MDRYGLRILIGLGVLQGLKILFVDNPKVLSTLDAAEHLVDASFHTIPSAQFSATPISRSTSTVSEDKPIRKWGCNRRETPLIFVHIGKAGGGGARIRLAGAAVDYNRTQWGQPDGDEHYYPIRPIEEDSGRQNEQSSSFRKGRFCNSKYAHHTLIPPNNKTEPVKTEKPYEGLKHCNATTPFGMAIACPSNYQSMSSMQRNGLYSSALCQGCDDEHYLMEKYYKDTSNYGQRVSASKKLVNLPPPEHTCDVVYVSHNNIGNEMNWLPPRYLKEHWWDNSVWKEGQNSNHKLEHLWKQLLDDRERRRTIALRNRNVINLIGRWNSTIKGILVDEREKQLRLEQREKKSHTEDKKKNKDRWCPQGYRTRYAKGGRRNIQYDRPAVNTIRWQDTENRYNNCVKPLGERADKLFKQVWKEKQRRLTRDDPKNMLTVEDPSNFSPIYASMPLHRVTMLRDPWSWIISKYFWHPTMASKFECQNVTARFTHSTLGWVSVHSLLYLFQLCGNECITRYENGFVTLEQIEAQVESNLRNAFSVVGLLHESDSFYDMIDKRIDYVDTKRLYDTNRKRNSHEYELISLLNAPLHMSGGSKTAKENCKNLFLKDETFREEVRRTVPEFAALERMYKVGVEVNRFQQDELSRC
mmetsp:Transcript_1024/g.2200  ORF Transcript_1024/g.2200 Transcript_1024/m.2200 type:complete len:642 (-) Transcript_1024:448-2373(-)|eukprot:CAMPEP_0172401984 /NCGR_PEP_ID=MMETSP1061-20121228/52784_1 /TAXON_ID=37318 /ORGANISM="Pseudo-nitzschia pungens, Strain cf. pungens" /LENGTH=641 /DNA_ID=CAMNT_0013135819 /DNA_START=183 /DNA_END=2108 /DNA_ORIENTATION=-